MWLDVELGKALWAMAGCSAVSMMSGVRCAMGWWFGHDFPGSTLDPACAIMVRGNRDAESPRDWNAPGVDMGKYPLRC
jgi:hypothetical protein